MYIRIMFRQKKTIQRNFYTVYENLNHHILGMFISEILSIANINL